MQSAGKRGEKEKSEVYASDFFVQNGRGKERLSSEPKRKEKKVRRNKTKLPKTAAKEKA